MMRPGVFVAATEAMGSETERSAWWVWTSLGAGLVALALFLFGFAMHWSDPSSDPRSGGTGPSTWPPPAAEMEFAEFDPANPLLVRLPSRPDLGPISVERFDSQGNPTGTLLSQGTQVMIPDPERPGERIYFRVP